MKCYICGRETLPDGDCYGCECDRLRARLRKTAQILIEEVGADGPCSAEKAAHRSVKRVRHLSACMNAAGLRAFMRGHEPKEIAEHLSNVAKSWARVEEFARAASRWRESCWEYDDDMGHERRDFHDEEEWEIVERSAREALGDHGKDDPTTTCDGRRDLDLDDPENYDGPDARRCPYCDTTFSPEADTCLAAALDEVEQLRSGLVEIADSGCGRWNCHEKTTCRDRHPNTPDAWCWCCRARAALAKEEN